MQEGNTGGEGRGRKGERVGGNGGGGEGGRVDGAVSAIIMTLAIYTCTLCISENLNATDL